MRKRGRGKNRRKGNKNKNGRKGKSKVTPEQLEFFGMFKELNGAVETPFEFYTDFDSYYKLNIISKKWLNKFEDYLQGKEPEAPTGDINECLVDRSVKEEEKFSWNKRPNCNCYLVRKIKFKRDYVPVTEAAWDWLNNAYPSTPLIKKFNLENRGFCPAFTSLEYVNVIFLDQAEGLVEQLKPRRVQFEDYDIWYDIASEVLKMIGGMSKRKERKEEVKRLKYYKVDRRVSKEELIADIEKQVEEGKEEVEFRGFPLKCDLDDLLDFDASDLFYSNTTVIIFRPREEDPKFSLTPVAKKLDSSVKEYCEYCEARDTLIYECTCKTVFYCSIRCRTKDIHFHSKTCLLSKNLNKILVLDSEEQILSKADQFSLTKGLYNLGNTCYMAALLQAFKLIQPFRDHILSIPNEQIQCLIDEQKPHESNVLPYFVNFMRNCCYAKGDVYKPWLIKAAIGVNNSEFLRFSQSDAQEFFQTLSELIENETKFWNLEDFFAKYMKGRSKQLNQCLECNNVTARPEDWKFLSLPIPEKTVYGVIACGGFKEDVFKFRKETCTLRELAATIVKKFGWSVEEEVTEGKEVDGESTDAENKSPDADESGIEEAIGEQQIDEDGQEIEMEFRTSTKKLVFAISDTEKIREIFYDMDQTVAEIEKIIQRPKYKTCGLILYELEEPAEDLYEDYYPLSVQFIQMSKTINSFMKQQVKTGFVGLRFAKNDATNRQIAASLVDYVAPLIPQELHERFNQVVEEDDRQILDNEEYALELESQRKEPRKDNMDIYTYTDLVFTKLFSSKVIKIDFDQLKFLDSDTFDGILQDFPNSRLGILKFLNMKKGKCWNCNNEGMHKCSFTPNSEISQLRPKFKEQPVEEGSEEAQKEQGKEEPKKVSVLKKSFQPIHCLSIFICDTKMQTILSKKSFVGLINKFSNPNILVPNVDIEYCIETYQKPEDLGEDCLVDCDNCGNKTRRQMKYVVDLLPDVLFIQLKRFKTTFRNGKIKRIKNKLFVKFSTQLSLKDDNGNEGTYELVSIVNHTGELNKGHYTAFGRDISEQAQMKQWYCFDDEKVRKVKLRQICTRHAYLLFYKKIEDPSTIVALEEEDVHDAGDEVIKELSDVEQSDEDEDEDRKKRDE